MNQDLTFTERIQLRPKSGLKRKGNKSVKFINGMSKDDFFEGGDRMITNIKKSLLEKDNNFASVAPVEVEFLKPSGKSKSLLVTNKAPSISISDLSKYNADSDESSDSMNQIVRNAK